VAVPPVTVTLPIMPRSSCGMIGLAALVAGTSVLRAVTRRER
jgi:hypothetical protein